MMKQEMQIIVDGLIYQDQKQGGISRIYSEIFPRICRLDESVHITIFTDGPLRRNLPEHSQITHQSLVPLQQFLYPRRIWGPLRTRVRNVVRRPFMKEGKNRIWHSTFYSQHKPWDGASVVTVYDLINELYGELTNEPRNEAFIEQKRRCIEEADAVICISEITRQDVLRFYEVDPQRVFVVHLAAGRQFRPLAAEEITLKAPTDRPFFLYIGGRAAYKNFDRMLQAFSRWLNGREYDLILIGAELTAQEKDRLAELNISRQVHVCHSVNDQDLCELYNQACGLIYPSIYEGFGIPVLEAMACGCPVIASRISTTEEIAGKIPVYFAAEDVDGFVKALEILAQEGRGSSRIQTGIEHAGSFSWEKTAQKTLEIYRAVLRKKGITPGQEVSVN